MKTKSFKEASAVLAIPFVLIWHWISWVTRLQNRERIRLTREMSQIMGLMPLLMKQRNGYHWSKQDRIEIREHLHHIAAISPYIILFVAPGGFFALPFLAWWVDRRRQIRDDKNTSNATS